MVKVKFTGEFPEILPTIGEEVKPGDVIDVPDDFDHPRFEPVNPKDRKKRGGDQVDAATE